ncbi:MAG: PilZ domain-containing protein [Anaerolineales bacterium]
MQERRKQPRKNLMSYSQVFDLYDGRLIGYLGDLNLLGAMVIGNQPMEINSELSISIQLPELPNISTSRMALPVRVAWYHKDISPEFLNIGLDFQLVTDEQKNIIEAVMENYEFRRTPPNYPPHPAELEH